MDKIDGEYEILYTDTMNSIEHIKDLIELIDIEYEFWHRSIIDRLCGTYINDEHLDIKLSILSSDLTRFCDFIRMKSCDFSPSLKCILINKNDRVIELSHTLLLNINIANKIPNSKYGRLFGLITRLMPYEHKDLEYADKAYNKLYEALMSIYETMNNNNSVTISTDMLARFT